MKRRGSSRTSKRTKKQKNKSFHEEDAWDSDDFEPLTNDESASESKSDSDPILSPSLLAALNHFRQRISIATELSSKELEDGMKLYEALAGYKSSRVIVSTLLQEIRKQLRSNFVTCSCGIQLKSENMKAHLLSPNHSKKLERQRLRLKLEEQSSVDSELSEEVWLFGEHESSDLDKDLSVDETSESSLDFQDVEFASLNRSEYANVSTLLLYEFFVLNHGKPFSERMMGWLLSFLAHEETSKNVAPSMYFLKQAGGAFVPQMVWWVCAVHHSRLEATEEFKLQSGTGSHFPIQKVLSQLLSHNVTTRNWIDSYNPGEDNLAGSQCMSCQSLLLLNCLAFRDYQMKLSPLLGTTHKLLLWSIFVDEYQKSRTQKQLLNALVLRLDMTRNVKAQPFPSHSFEG